MLAVPSVNEYNFFYSNITASATPGTSVTPGASNAEGSWTQIASAANIAQDVYEIGVWVYAGATATAQKDHLLDIGWDTAGGTDYVERIANIVCGGSFGTVGTGHFFKFPIFIRAGSTVAVRIQGSNGTAGTVTVVMSFYGQPSHPELIRVGQYSETVGTITSTSAVAFTPGTNAAEGAWVSLGTTTRPMWWWQIGVQVSSSAIQSRGYTIDLAHGDTSEKIMIIENFYVRTTNNEETNGVGTFFNSFCEVPTGASLFIRGSCSGVPDAGWNAVAIGIGG